MESLVLTSYLKHIIVNSLVVSSIKGSIITVASFLYILVLNTSSTTMGSTVLNTRCIHITYTWQGAKQIKGIAQ